MAADDHRQLTTTGLRLLGQGRGAEVYAWEEGTVLRLQRGTGGREILELEARAMAAAEDARVPVPAVHGLVEADGRHGMLMDRVEGPDLLSLLSRRPHRVRWAAQLLAEVHAAVVAAPAPGDLPSPHADLVAELRASAQVPDDIADRASELLATLDDGDRLGHGDFHPGNVLLGPEGPVVIDWTGAFRGNPLADHAHTCVLLALGEPPPGTPRFVLALIRVVRQVFLRHYRAELARRVEIDPDAFDRWVMVSAANRLREGIASERGLLLELAAGTTRLG